jgi:hypothetical protein
LVGLPQRAQIASVLVMDSARQSNSGIGGNGRPMKSVSSPTKITCLPASANFPANPAKSAEKMGFVNADHLSAPVELRQYFLGVRDRFRLHALVVMRNDFAGGVSVVERRLERLHLLAGDARAPQATDQFFAFARKHGSANNFHPSDGFRYHFHVQASIANQQRFDQV